MWKKFYGVVRQAQWASIAAATTTDFSTATGNVFSVTGNATIVSFWTVDADVVFDVSFTGTPLLTYNATSLKLPSEANIQVVAGDRMRIKSLGSGNWEVLNYTRKDGKALYETPFPVVDSLYSDLFAAGEAIGITDAVFVEWCETQSNAINSQNIGRVGVNTRISFPIFGSGNSGSTLKLNLSKTWSPSVSLGFRIETDDWSGNPSWTLFDANAIGTVSAGSLTTSLEDTTVTLWGSFTIPNGQKCHVVWYQWTYWSETVNDSNFYNIWYSSKNTTTRFWKFWNGSAWSNGSGIVATENSLYVQNSWGAETQSYGYRIEATTNCLLLSVTAGLNTTANRCRVFTDAGVLIATASFTGSWPAIAVFSTPVVFTAGQFYRIESDSSGSSYQKYNSSNNTFPVVCTNITYNTWSVNQSNTASKNSIQSINTIASNPYVFPYTVSSLFSMGVLSKTSAQYSYKVDFYGFSKELVSAVDLVLWKKPNIIFGGIASGFTGLTEAVIQYLSNTPWAISNSPWSNSRKVWMTFMWNTTTVKIVDIPL